MTEFVALGQGLFPHPLSYERDQCFPLTSYKLPTSRESSLLRSGQNLVQTKLCGSGMGAYPKTDCISTSGDIH